MLSLRFRCSEADSGVAATAFGVVGTVAGLGIMREPFGFTAFLGVTSLIGVIVDQSLAPAVRLSRVPPR